MDLVKLTETIIKNIVIDPESVSVKEFAPEEENTIQIEVLILSDDMGKVIGKNGRNIKLPIDIKTIKNYCLSTEIKKEQIYDTLMWIALRYIAISRCLSWNEWLQEYENNKELENSSN